MQVLHFDETMPASFSRPFHFDDDDDGDNNNYNNNVNRVFRKRVGVISR